MSPESVTHTHSCDICTQDTRTHPVRCVPSETCIHPGRALGIRRSRWVTTVIAKDTCLHRCVQFKCTQRRVQRNRCECTALGVVTKGISTLSSGQSPRERPTHMVPSAQTLGEFVSPRKQSEQMATQTHPEVTCGDRSSTAAPPTGHTHSDPQGQLRAKALRWRCLTFFRNDEMARVTAAGCMGDRGEGIRKSRAQGFLMEIPRPRGL